MTLQMFATYSIRVFNTIILFLIILSCFYFCGTPVLSEDDYNAQCPYERKLEARHFYLETPVFVEPEKLVYKVGDTLSIIISLSDSIYDLSREATFSIKDYPFHPICYLYRVDTEGWHSGYSENQVIVDSIFHPGFGGERASWSSNVQGFSTYDNGQYFYQHKVVLTTPGRYVNYMADAITAINLDDVNDRLAHPEYLNVTNDSGCPEPHFYTVCYIYQGDPRYEEFHEEMKFVDEEVYWGKLFKIGMELDDPTWGGLDRFGGTESQQKVVDFSGIFGFEVVE